MPLRMLTHEAGREVVPALLLFPWQKVRWRQKAGHYSSPKRRCVVASSAASGHLGARQLLGEQDGGGSWEM